MFLTLIFVANCARVSASEIPDYQCLDCTVEATSEGKVLLNYDLVLFRDAKKRNLFKGSLAVRFVDQNGKLVPVKDVSLTSYMPGMGHGSGKEPTAKPETIDDNERAAVWISNDVIFTMAGIWRISVQFKGAGKDDEARIIAWVRKPESK
ncbi:MAG TPA: FixH family protein [Oligoflexia bacterium]|nr:FixH family protein [Oligoflexia bacterium]